MRFVDINDDTTLDLDDLERQLSDRTRVVAFPVASNAVGTLTDVRRIVELAHDAGALAWADAVHYGPHGPIDVTDWGVDVLICSPYKFFGPHLGLAFGRAELLETWRPYKVRPAPDTPLGRRFETGTLAHELLAGIRRRRRIHRVDRLGVDQGARAHTRRALPRRPARQRHALRASDDGRPCRDLRVQRRRRLRPRRRRHASAKRAMRCGEGDYYAVEVMKRLGLGQGGAVRAGIVHYNTADEVDGLLAEIAKL